MHCHRYTRVDAGQYSGAYSGGPEYETLAAFGAGCGIDDIDALIKINELCNIYGLDTISTGSVIQWVMECYERNVLTKDDLNGMEARWGNVDFVLDAIEKITYRKGIGDLLAEGLKVAAEKIGKDSWKWAIQVRGLEQSRVDTRSAKAYALAFAVNPRGPDHLHAQPMAEFGAYKESRELIKALFGDEKYANPYITDKKPELVRWHEDIFAITDSLGLCSFSTTTSYIILAEELPEIFTAITGIKINYTEMMLAGRRIINVERAYNLREGHRGREDDKLPWRLMHEPVPSGPAKGLKNSPEELSKMLKEYYRLHEWDEETGYPKKETLERLGLGEIARELEKIGKCK